MKYNKGFTGVAVLLVVLGVLIVGGVAYFAGKSSAPKSEVNELNDDSNYSPVDTENKNDNKDSSNSIENSSTKDSTKATLIIKKDSIPDHSQDFSFVVKGVSSEIGVSNYLLNFALDDEQASATPNTKVLQLIPGTYSISETKVAGWDTSWSCAPGIEGGVDTGSGNTKTVDIGAGKSVTCAFVSAKVENTISSLCLLPTTSPMLTVLSPNGGETYTAGQQITVKWESCNINNQVGLTLSGFPVPNSTQFFLGNWVASSVGSQTVTIPSTVQSGKYTINISTPPHSSPGIEDWSNNFFTIN